MHLLILYEELAWYFVNCLNALAQSHGVKILVISRQVNQVAPFEFKNLNPAITILYRENFEDNALLDKCRGFSPNMVYLGGWAYKPYIRVVKKLACPKTVIGFDNQFSFSLKQLLGSLYFRLTLKPYIQYAFVPGPRQAKFAGILGFKNKTIGTGAYCCDTALFTRFKREASAGKTAVFPKRFLFVGRYAPEKGIALLWDCFAELQQETPNVWELWCIGKGDIAPISHPKIKHLGFLQPEDLGPVIAQTGVFVLPSTFEPWGVVIHEYACAGFPMLCTNKAGATDTFLKHNENGFIIDAGNKQELKRCLKQFMSMSDKNLNLMAEKSALISQNITPQTWVENLMRLYASR